MRASAPRSTCGAPASSRIRCCTGASRSETTRRRRRCSESERCLSGCCAPALSADQFNNPVLKFLARLLEYRLSLRLSLFGVASLCAAIAVQLLAPTLALAKRLPLLTALAVTSIPTISDVSMQLTQSLETAVNVNFLMMLAAIVLALSGSLIEAALLTTLCALSFSTEEAVSQRARRQLDALTKIAPSVALRFQTPSDPNPVEIPLNSVTP